MKKRIFVSATAIIVVAFAVVISVMAFSPQQSESDLLLNENIEALTSGEEGIAVADCYFTWGTGETIFANRCDGRTSVSMIYPCPTSNAFVPKSARGTCYLER